MESFASIGVLGGVGPYAGLDLVQKIFNNTRAARDQEHLPVTLLSFPGDIADRIDFLVHGTGKNPGVAIGCILIRLANGGATVLGIPCNTAHSSSIKVMPRLLFSLLISPAPHHNRGNRYFRTASRSVSRF